MNDEDSGRVTQRNIHPLAMINWEPPIGQAQLPEDSPANNQITRFEKNVISKSQHAWSDWYKVRRFIPSEMQGVVRSVWEGYTKSAGMGADPFLTVMALVRRKVGLPFQEELLHKLQGKKPEASEDEQTELAVQEMCEDSQVRDGTEELGETIAGQ
jgi:hypothetical protein